MLKRHDFIYRLLRSLTVVLFSGCFLAACVSAPTLKPVDSFSPEAVEKFNNIARDANAYLYPQDDKVFTNALNAVLKDESRHMASLKREMTRLARKDLDEWDTFTEFNKIFARRGVVVNLDFKAKGEMFYKLEDYRMTDQLQHVLVSSYAPLWETAKLAVPDIKALRNKSMFHGYNYHTDYLTVIDLPAINLMAGRLELDSQKSIDYVALHEAAHAINEKIYAVYPDFDIEQHLDDLSATTEHRVQFRSAPEVEEFLADAVAVQHGDTATRFLASRIIRGGERLGTTFELEDSTKTALLYPHDASAQFIQSLMIEQRNQLNVTSTNKSISWLCEHGNAHADDYTGLPYLPWIQEHWNPLIDELFTPEFSSRIRDEYRSALTAMLKLVSTTMSTRKLPGAAQL